MAWILGTYRELHAWLQLGDICLLFMSVLLLPTTHYRIPDTEHELWDDVIMSLPPWWQDLVCMLVVLVRTFRRLKSQKVRRLCPGSKTLHSVCLQLSFIFSWRQIWQKDGGDVWILIENDRNIMNPITTNNFQSPSRFEVSRTLQNLI